ncbi:uncharacterized protein LOC133171994 [Saccostrea echinata]|uniref:uncharacterized protein LOC133171994 n=1 Tax=Saccostrea echinata TaxID=191078 RepID=UPI002A83B63A|nr:uncharacterized protein LOC133171994 [Saccostrea echinata]
MNLSLRVLKLTLACALGIVTIIIINNRYSSRNVVIQTNALTGEQTSQTKCGEHDDDFRFSGLETVKPLTEKVPMKFRSKEASCSQKNFLKLNDQLTFEETRRKMECARNWVKDHKQGSDAFWMGNTQYIRHSHHTYLNKDSTVFDIGGNKGEDAEAMIKRYNPGTYVILEPIKTLFSKLVRMFESNKKVTLYNFGLARKDEKFYVNVLGHGGDATSIFSGNDNGGSCLLRVVNTTQFLLQVGISCYEVDLITINCEGCEFEIMEEILASGMIGQFRHIQFATHPTLKHLKNPAERYCEIQEKLKRTHKASYQYKWCWESWTRKDLL